MTRWTLIPPRRRGRVAASALLLATLLAAPPAAGEPTVSPTEDALRPGVSASVPRFHIEAIAVEGVRRAKPEVIVSETLLAEGHSYTETELREAVYRVVRLPFVLDASFSLGKGSERGRYRLLVTVTEVRSFFFGADLVYLRVGGSLERGSTLDDDVAGSLSAGARLFAGNGTFFAALGDNGDPQLGYTRYKLFGRRLLLNVAVARERCCPVRVFDPGLDPVAGSWEATDESDRLDLTLGVPLGGNHSLRLGATRLATDSGVRRSLGGAPGESVHDYRDFERREVELAWIFDTTDDPLFPTRGDRMSAAVGFKVLDADLASRPPLTEPGLGTRLAATRSRLVGLTLAGQRNWALTRRQTLALDLKLLASRSTVDNVPLRGGGLAGGEVDSWEGDLQVRYSLALWGPRRVRRSGELRWETVAGLLYVETSPVFDPATQPLVGVRVATTVALRSSWGVFRFGFTYLDLGGGI